MADFVRLLSFNSCSLCTSLNSLHHNQLLFKNNCKRVLSVAADSCLSSDFTVNSRFAMNPKKESLQFKYSVAKPNWETRSTLSIKGSLDVLSVALENDNVLLNTYYEGFYVCNLAT
ncbi:hypothetical protein Ccrd_003982, partial [Cynara cardunculus var. scolymus]